MTLILFIIACWGWYCLVVYDERPVTAFVFTPLVPFTLTLWLLALYVQHLVERLAEWEDRHGY